MRISDPCGQVLSYLDQHTLPVMLLLHHVCLRHEVVDLLEVRGVVQSLHDLHRPLAGGLANRVEENLHERDMRIERMKGGFPYPLN